MKSKVQAEQISALALGATLLTLSCSGEVVLGEELPSSPSGPSSCQLASPSSQNDRPEIHLFSFWKHNPDKVALLVLQERAQQLGLFSLTILDTRAELQAAIAERLQNTDLSTDEIYQVNGGSDILQYALDDSQIKVCDLEPIYEQYNIRERFFEAAWKPSECQGVPLAVPLNVHRVNTVMVNMPIYESLQLLATEAGTPLPPFEQLSSAEELISMLEFAQEQALETESGEPIVPLSLCIGNETWPLHHVAFESILASYGSGFYEAIWQGSNEHTEVEKRAAVARLSSDLGRLGQVSSLGPGFNPNCLAHLTDDNKVTWQMAADMVIAGQALLTIGGDWMGGLVAEDWLGDPVPDTRRENVKIFPFPSENQVFVYTPDGFALAPRKGTDGSSAHAWYRDVVDDSEFQVEFSRVKHSIPARKGLTDELAGLESEYLTASYNEFGDCQEDDSSCRLLLAVSGLGPANGVDPCWDSSVGMLLATVAGIEYTEEQWEARDCGEGIPTNRDEAEELLSHLLLDTSQLPFAADCRD